MKWVRCVLTLFSLLAVVHMVSATATVSGGAIIVSGSETWDSVYSQISGSATWITYYSSNDTYVIDASSDRWIKLDPLSTLTFGDEVIKVIGASGNNVNLHTNVSGNYSITFIFDNTTIQLVNHTNFKVFPGANCDDSSKIVVRNLHLMGEGGDDEVYLPCGNMSVNGSITLDNVFLNIEGCDYASSPKLSISGSIHGNVGSLVIPDGIDVVFDNIESITGEFAFLALIAESSSSSISNMQVSGTTYLAGVTGETLDVRDSVIQISDYVKPSDFSAFPTALILAGNLNFSNTTIVPNPDFDEIYVPSGFTTNVSNLYLSGDSEAKIGSPLVFSNITINGTLTIKASAPVTIKDTYGRAFVTNNSSIVPLINSSGVFIEMSSVTVNVTNYPNIMAKAVSGEAYFKDVVNYIVGQRYTFVINSTNPSTQVQITLAGFDPGDYVDVYYTKDGTTAKLETYQANSSGYISFVYDKGFSDVTFDVKLNETPPTTTTTATTTTPPTTTTTATTTTPPGLPPGTTTTTTTIPVILPPTGEQPSLWGFLTSVYGILTIASIITAGFVLWLIGRRV